MTENQVSQKEKIHTFEGKFSKMHAVYNEDENKEHLGIVVDFNLKEKIYEKFKTLCNFSH